MDTGSLVTVGVRATREGPIEDFGPCTFATKAPGGSRAPQRQGDDRQRVETDVGEDGRAQTARPLRQPAEDQPGQEQAGQQQELEVDGAEVSMEFQILTLAKPQAQ